MKIFVYGTLMKDEGNHDLLQGAKFLGEFQTKPEYTLYDLGAFPGMVEGGETSVHGEVYEVNQETLKSLDWLEGVPHFYERKYVWFEDGEGIEGYVLSKRFAGRCNLGMKIFSGEWKYWRRMKEVIKQEV